jgi:hypothetical protein
MIRGKRSELVSEAIYSSDKINIKTEKGGRVEIFPDVPDW